VAAWARRLFLSGFGDRVYPAPSRKNFPSLLPDLLAADVLMYPPETVVAEKFEAMIRFGEANGRIKDFHDIWVTARTFPFDLSTLVEAVAGTLQRRETDAPTEMPVALTAQFAGMADKQALWTGFLRRNPPTLPPPPFDELLIELRRFGTRLNWLLALSGGKSRTSRRTRVLCPRHEPRTRSALEHSCFLYRR
jgi:Nucleotidyl transferase AbiEii toxin, Type IV TA system